MNIGGIWTPPKSDNPMTASKVGTFYSSLLFLCMFCLLISQVMLYVSEDTNKLPPSTLVSQTAWYVAH